MPPSATSIAASAATAQRLPDARPAPLFLQRALSAIVLAPPVLAAVWWGGLPFALMIALAAAIMCWEWHRIVNGGFGASGWVAAASASLAALAAAILPIAALPLVLAGSVGSALMVDGNTRARAWVGFGALYAGLPSAALVWLRSEGEGGLAVVAWLFLLVWATDIGAYAAGRGIGGPKLMPRVSPNKTWAGLLGGMFSAALAGLGVALWLNLPGTFLLPVASAVLAVIAQAGDLGESWVKRHFGVKDSSAIIPGHGGLLDRVDGLLTAGLALSLLAMAGGLSAFGWN